MDVRNAPGFVEVWEALSPPYARVEFTEIAVVVSGAARGLSGHPPMIIEAHVPLHASFKAVFDKIVAILVGWKGLNPDLAKRPHTFAYGEVGVYLWDDDSKCWQCVLRRTDPNAPEGWSVPTLVALYTHGYGRGPVYLERSCDLPWDVDHVLWAVRIWERTLDPFQREPAVDDEIRALVARRDTWGSLKIKKFFQLLLLPKEQNAKYPTNLKDVEFPTLAQLEEAIENTR